MGNPVVHFEIGCKSTSEAAGFYASLFDWQTQQVGPALMVQTGSNEGIQGHFAALGYEPHHHTIFYVQVDDIDAKLDEAKSLGGSVVVPRQDIPNYGSFAWMSDPDGNVIGLWKAA